MESRALPYVILLGTITGTSLIASRFVIVNQIGPTTYTALRLSLAGLAYVFFYLLGIQGRRLPTSRRLWLHSMVLGILDPALPMTLNALSLQYQSSGITSILLTLVPATIVVMAHFFLPNEPLTRRKSLGVFLALLGAILLAILGESGLPDVARVNPIGYLVIIVSVVSISAATIYARRHMKDFDIFDVSFVRVAFAAIIILPLSILVEGFDLSRVNQQGLIAVGYVSLIGTFSGFLLGFYTIKRFGTTPSAIVWYLIPIITGIGGALLLGEQLTTGIFVGMALIFSGIVIINQQVQD
jgi:drug/metabolite transporter (DMT)-like permease